MREKGIGVESEKGVIASSEAQAIEEVKERVLLSEWQRQIEKRQNGGYSVDEWCRMQGISKSCYYHRLRRVRKYLCQITGVLPEEQHLKGSVQRQIVPLKEITGAQAHRSAGTSEEYPHNNPRRKKRRDGEHRGGKQDRLSVRISFQISNIKFFK